MEESVKKQRNLNFDLLRITCCFLVVVLHFSSSYWFTVEIGSNDFNVMTVYNSMTRVAVPIFLMLSGCFLLDSAKPISVKKYISRPLFFLITIYLWSAFYAFQGLLFELVKSGSCSSERLHDSVSRFINGHYHMWFCFLIAGYYILLPIARKIAEDLRILWFFFILWCIFAFIIPCTFSWLNLPAVVAYFEKYEFSIISGYFGYFFLGYLINNTNFTRKIRLIIYVMGIWSIAATAVLTIHQSVILDSRVEKWFSPGSLLILIASFSFFLFFKEIPIYCGMRLAKMITKLSAFCFFIYMFHVFILEKMNLLGITTISFAPILSIPMLSLFSFIISVLIAYLLSKIPVIKKYILYYHD